MCANRSRARSRESWQASLGRKLRPTRARHPRHSNSTGGPLQSACTAALLAPAVPQTTRTRASVTAAPIFGRPGPADARCRERRSSYCPGSRRLVTRGLRDGGTFKFIRKALGLLASELGDLLDVSPETISRWENSHRPAERSVWNTLADLVDDKLHGKNTTLDRLTAPKAGVPKQPVRLRLGLAGAK
jgi:DNA-binding XRE family transcriptional regulator